MSRRQRPSGSGRIGTHHEIVDHGTTAESVDHGFEARPVIVNCWGRAVELPGLSRILQGEEESNVIEVLLPSDANLPLLELTNKYELIFKVVDGNLVIRNPCPAYYSSTQLVREILLYAHRSRSCSCDYIVSSSYHFFRCSGQLVNPEVSISEKTSFDESQKIAFSLNRRNLQDVDMLLVIEFYDIEEDAKRGVSWLAKVTKAAAFGLVVPGWVVQVACLDEQGNVKLDRLEAPRFIDVTPYCRRLSGMRLYPSHYLGSLWLGETGTVTAALCELHTRLVESTKEGRTQEAYEIVNMVDYLNFVDPVHGNTPLLAAVQSQSPDLRLIEFLVDNGASPTTKASSGIWPYLYAVVHNMLEVVDALDDDGKSKAHLATLSSKELCETENPELLRMLLQLGLPPNQSYQGILPLVEGLHGRNRMERLKLLLEAGADPILRDKNGSSALSLICGDRPLEMVRLVARACKERGVLDHKVDPVNTALGLACLYEELAVCSVLLEYGASPSGTYCNPPQDLKTGLQTLFSLKDTPLPECLK